MWSCYQPSTSFRCTHSPPLGFDVTPPLISGSSPLANAPPSSNVVSNRPTHAANKHSNSACANFCPIQLLGPCKKVRKLKLDSAPPLLFALPSASSQRSGLNSSASGPQASVEVLIAHGGRMMVVPLGTNWPLMLVSHAAERSVMLTGAWRRRT